MALTLEQDRFWQAYLTDLEPGNRPQKQPIAAIPGSPEIADQLIDLYLSGQKTAGSGLVEDYLAAGDPLPQVGDHWIALDSALRPRCILRTERIETHLFKDVPESIARAEGEGDLSLAHWKRVHALHFEPHLAEWAVGDLDEATVVTEFFTLVHR